METLAVKTSKKKNLTINLVLIGIVIILAILPMALLTDAEFGGADGQAEEVITEINSEYTPWFEQIWAPPSGEIESMLFALQAAIGSGVLFFGLGYMKGRSKKREEEQ